MCRYAGTEALDPDTEIDHMPRLAPALTIGFALPKADRPEWIVQKLTEIGVDSIIVLHAERSIVRWEPDRAARHIAKLAKVAREASMQSRRVWLPTIGGPTQVESMAAPGTAPNDMAPNDMVANAKSANDMASNDMVANAKSANVIAALPIASPIALADPDGAVLTLATSTVLIGPEGGWTAGEMDRFASRVRLGSSILRVETAALVAAAQLSALRDIGITP